jgi:metal-sulfur cluster biosynthetic enzyme
LLNEDMQDLEQAIIEQLQTVIDPETGADVRRT